MRTLYRALLALYPRRFRERYAVDLLQAFGEDPAEFMYYPQRAPTVRR